MATVMVPMPQVSESITSGAIFELPIATGQKVEENEVVAVVETEKVCF
jgi:pyruvate/2-oxoglutarate dehydrogenase complex dihydrolipoamide acyltransferase (E2) component